MAHICRFLDARHGARSDGSDALLVGPGTSRTALELRGRVAALAAGLKASGLQAGDRAALVGQSSAAFLEALLAVTAAGGIAVLLNWRWSAQETSRALTSVQASHLFADNSLAARLQPALLPAGLQLLGLGPSSDGQETAEEVIGRHWGAELACESPGDGAAVICFTSGTTGKPKGAVLSHTALCFQALAKLIEVGYSAADVYLHTAPLFHVGGLSSLLAALAAGSTQVFMPVFSAAATLRLIAEHSVTAFIAVPTMVVDLLAELQRTGLAGTFPSVQRILLGGGHLAPALVVRLQAVFPQALLTTAYGMSEACSSMTFHPLGASPNTSCVRGACVGYPPPGVQIAIRRTAPSRDSLLGTSSKGEPGTEGSGQVGEVGTVEGEIVTAGPHVMLRYWTDPTATAAALSPGVWLRTGDLGFLDASGALWLVGRLGDVIRTGGESVPGPEVETVLERHPGVRRAAVVGVPEERLGQVVAALLSLEPGWTWQAESRGRGSKGVLTLAALRHFLSAEGLASYKQPRLVQVGDLPLTEGGKVAKHAVREVLTSLAQRSHSRL